MLDKPSLTVFADALSCVHGNSPLEREGDALSAQIENMAHLAHKDQIFLSLLAERPKSARNYWAGT